MNHYAVVSDIHSNLEAFQSVLKDIKQREIPVIYCLGDLVGYGPNPKEIIDASSQFEFTIMGNHDEAAAGGDYSKFNYHAVMAIKWTRKILKLSWRKYFGAKDYIKILKNLPDYKIIDTVLFSHGSPRSNKEYINTVKVAEEIFQLEIMNNITVCFVGHVHVPKIFELRNKEVSIIKVKDDYKYEISDNVPIIVDIGSVGQPRDSDWRASYVEIKNNLLQFHRVEYDVETTMKKIYKNNNLDDRLADRLR